MHNNNIITTNFLHIIAHNRTDTVHRCTPIRSNVHVRPTDMTSTALKTVNNVTVQNNKKDDNNKLKQKIKRKEQEQA